MAGRVEYWLGLCDDDLKSARALLKSKRLLHMGFFCHMAVEKALKAVIASRTDTFPPKIRDLPKLAYFSGVWDKLDDWQKALIESLKPLEIETYYHEYKNKMASGFDYKHCRQLLGKTKEFIRWIRRQLRK